MKSSIILLLLISTTLTSKQENQNLRRLQPGSSSTNSYNYNSIAATESVTTSASISTDKEATAADTSVIYVSSTGSATIGSNTISKTSGDSSNTENSEFYGVNAAILVNGGSATLTGTTVTTAAKGANAIFATNSGTITINGGTITSTGASSARGLDATYGGKITANSLTINTSGGSCASLATDRGEGTVSCTSCTLTTAGAGSPVIYSTGDITITSSTGTATGAQMVVVEGKNSATVKSSTLKCTGIGNRNNVDKCGVMIYQSQSGDADDGIGSFTASDSKMEILSSSSVYSSAPMFFVTNTEATITLSNVTFTYGSGIFLDIEGTDQWGTSGSNGGDVTMTVTGQTIVGDIVVDDYSSLTLKLSSSSSFKGKINSAKSSGSIYIVIDASSKITLTGDSYITKLENADSSGSNIDTGSYSFKYSNSSYLKVGVFTLLFLIFM